MTYVTLLRLILRVKSQPKSHFALYATGKVYTHLIIFCILIGFRLKAATMLETLKLLFPVFIPSWQFFKEIAPSPRIEFALLRTNQDQAKWQELKLRAASTPNLLISLFYNPHWNEALYIMNCAEQLIVSSQDFYAEEILKYIKTELKLKQPDLEATPYLQFRLLFTSRDQKDLREDLLYSSEIKEI